MVEAKLRHVEEYGESAARDGRFDTFGRLTSDHDNYYTVNDWRPHYLRMYFANYLLDVIGDVTEAFRLFNYVIA